jgi:hypothetical protein
MVAVTYPCRLVGDEVWFLVCGEGGEARVRGVCFFADEAGRVLAVLAVLAVAYSLQLPVSRTEGRRRWVAA